MKRTMIACAVISSMLTVTLIGWYALSPQEWIETLAITAGTAAYHFDMRLLVGAAWSPLEHKVNPSAGWFALRRFEPPLYKALRVKRWKARVPTYDPDAFDIRKHSVTDILCATCHSERVHETILVLSFLPLVGTVWFDAFWAFLLTSVGAALIDLVFVIVQRFNRPRLRTLLRRQEKSAAAHKTLVKGGQEVCASPASSCTTRLTPRLHNFRLPNQRFGASGNRNHGEIHSTTRAMMKSNGSRG